MREMTWYATLVKPDWAPPAWLFGPVWTALYAIIAVTFAVVFYRVARGRWPVSVAVPFALNLVFNLAFSPIQFGLQDNLLAAADIAFVWVTLVWMLAVVYRRARWIALANIPYLLWVSFATVLQFTITWLNR